MDSQFNIFKPDIKTDSFIQQPNQHKQNIHIL